MEINLNFDTEHVKTIKYRGVYQSRNFDYYVPKSVLQDKEDATWPTNIKVIIMKTDLPQRELGFLGGLISPRTENDFCEYEFLKENVNSVRYVSIFDGQEYSLYAPKAVFGTLSYPERLLVYITA